jgi:hypothetical protein
MVRLPCSAGVLFAVDVVVVLQGFAVAVAVVPVVAVEATMAAVLSATGLKLLLSCAVAVRSAELTIGCWFPGTLPCGNNDVIELPTVTKSRDILIQMRKNAIVTNIPRPP